MTLEESNPSGVSIPAAHPHGPAHHFGPAAVGLSLLTAALWGGTAVGSRLRSMHFRPSPSAASGSPSRRYS